MICTACAFALPACPVGLWYASHIDRNNISVGNYISLMNATFYLQNVYQEQKIAPNHPCVVKIGPYKVSEWNPANTTLDITASEPYCTESLRGECHTGLIGESAVCRIDSSFDNTDSFVCQGENML